MLHFVYILKCNDGSYYTGLTYDIKKRISEHINGDSQYTKNRRPIKLVCFMGFPNIHKAANFEKYLKSHSGMAFRNKHFV